MKGENKEGFGEPGIGEVRAAFFVERVMKLAIFILAIFLPGCLTGFTKYHPKTELKFYEDVSSGDPHALQASKYQKISHVHAFGAWASFFVSLGLGATLYYQQSEYDKAHSASVYDYDKLARIQHNMKVINGVGFAVDLGWLYSVIVQNVFMAKANSAKRRWAILHD